MKKTLFALSTLALLSLVIFGCKKKTPSTGSWSATVSANGGAATSVSGGVASGAETLGIFLVGLTQSSATAYPTMSIQGGAIGSGTYALNDTSSVQLTYTSSTESYSTYSIINSYISNGTITITINGSTVSGTFSGTAYAAATGDSVVITKGTFSGPWQ